MSTISEAEVEDAGRNNAIRTLNVVQQRNGKYRLLVQLNWKGGVFTVITQRKSAKEWASLDRLVNHIKHSYGNISVIAIHISN